MLDKMFEDLYFLKFEEGDDKDVIEIKKSIAKKIDEIQRYLNKMESRIKKEILNV